MMVQFTYQLKSSGEQDFDFEAHAEYEVYYFHSGSCTYLIGNRVYALSPGDLIIMHGMTLHRPNPDPSVEYCRSHILFDPRYIQGLLSQPDMLNLLQPFQLLRNHRIHLPESRRCVMERLLREMSTCNDRQQPVARAKFLTTFLQLLIEVYDECQKLKCHDDASTGKERLVEQVISTVENHYDTDITPVEIAEMLHLSKSYLSHLFKELTGVTVMDYVISRRIRQAKFLFLVENRLSVTEVSYRVGFKHLAHFSRVFKEQVGKTPEQYRKFVRERQYDEIEI